MTDKQYKLIHLFYGSLVGIVTVIAGICLIVACVGIYRSGDEPYSREAVAAAFSPIAVPVYLCLSLVIGGFFVNLFVPAEKVKIKAGRYETLTLRRFHAKTDLSRCDEKLRRSILKEHKNRRLHLIISTSLFIAGSMIFLIYALNFEHFHPTEMNASMISAMKLLVPCLGIPFAYIVFTTYYHMKSVHRELDLVKQAYTGGAKKEDHSKNSSEKPEKPTAEKCLIAVRSTILIVAVGLMILGIATGGLADVLAKAINICTECIGLG